LTKRAGNGIIVSCAKKFQEEKMLKFWLQRGLLHVSNQLKSKLNGRKLTVGIYAFAGNLFAMHDEFTKLIADLAGVGIICYPLHPLAVRAWFKDSYWHKNIAVFSGQMADMVIGLNCLAERGHAEAAASCMYDLELRYPDGVWVSLPKRVKHFCSSCDPESVIQQSMDEILLKTLQAILDNIQHPHKMILMDYGFWPFGDWNPEPLTGRASGYYNLPFAEYPSNNEGVDTLFQDIAHNTHLPWKVGESLSLPDSFRDSCGWNDALRKYFLRWLGRFLSGGISAEYIRDMDCYKILLVDTSVSQKCHLIYRSQEKAQQAN